MKYFDLMLPRDNEAELAEEAAKLDVIPIFLYPFRNPKEIARKKDELRRKGIKAFVGVYVRPRSSGDIKKAAKLWLAADFLAAINPGELVRVTVTNPRFDLVLRVPQVFGKDAPEYRRSNWNSILTNIAARNKVAYGVDFSYFLETSGYSLAKLLGREMQNLYLCRRKVPVVIASLATFPLGMRLPENLASFAKVLGLNTAQSKAAISSAIGEILERKEKRRSGAYVQPGVELVE